MGKLHQSLMMNFGNNGHQPEGDIQGRRRFQRFVTANLSEALKTRPRT